MKRGLTDSRLKEAFAGAALPRLIGLDMGRRSMPPPEPDVAPELQRHWLVLHADAASGLRLLRHVEAACEFRASLVAAESEAKRLLPPHGAFDGAVLDAGPTETEAARLCRHLRRCGVMIPLLIVGEWSNLDAVVGGLESGADDFIPRSCSPRLLAARMRSHLRTFDGCEHAMFPIGGLRFHPFGRTLLDPVHGRRVRLTELETRLLQRLLGANGRPVAREALVARRRGQRALRGREVDDHMERLRQKIRPVGGRVCPARTATGGYRLARVPEAEMGLIKPPAPASHHSL